MTDENDFAILNVRQTALDKEAEAAQLVDELAAGLGIEDAWERIEITNLGAEGTDQATRFPAVPQTALVAAVKNSPKRAEVARYFVVASA
jgi:hypothetical protein